MPDLIIVTGVMAVGKSTVAQALAEGRSRAVHLRGDVFRKMVVTGREEMTAQPSLEAISQLTLRYELSAMVARRYLASGFDVIYQDVIVGPMLTEVLNSLSDLEPKLVVLRASTSVIEQRERQRPKVGYTDLSVESFLGVYETTPKRGYWLDTSSLSVDATVRAIENELARDEVV